MRRPPRGPFLPALLLVLLLVGCAGQQPQTLDLQRAERQEVEAGFAGFTARACPLTLDADITLEVQLLGKSEKSPGSLQYEGPSSLRYAVVDPLGRSHFIMATNGYDFTMVYNREARAVTGSTATSFWREQVPAGVEVADLLLMLAGRLPANLRLKEVRGDLAGAGYWLFAVGSDGLRHEVLFDHNVARILRHILKDGDDKVLFDVTYDEYEETEAPCARPVLLRVDGKTITGTLVLHFDKFYSDQSFPPQTFRITPPGHFTVEMVE